MKTYSVEDLRAGRIPGLTKAGHPTRKRVPLARVPLDDPQRVLLPAPLHIALPIHAENRANQSRHWTDTRKQAKAERDATVHALLTTHPGAPPILPLVVVITIRSPTKPLDDDGTITAAKSLRDGVAEWARCDDGPSVPIAWLARFATGEGCSIDVWPVHLGTEAHWTTVTLGSRGMQIKAWFAQERRDQRSALLGYPLRASANIETETGACMASHEDLLQRPPTLRDALKSLVRIYDTLIDPK